MEDQGRLLVEEQLHRYSEDGGDARKPRGSLHPVALSSGLATSCSPGSAGLVSLPDPSKVPDPRIRNRRGAERDAGPCCVSFFTVILPRHDPSWGDGTVKGP